MSSRTVADVTSIGIETKMITTSIVYVALINIITRFPVTVQCKAIPTSAVKAAICVVAELLTSCEPF
jgi:hypothetical protein